MTNTFQSTTIGGFKVTIFTGYDGKQLFITNAAGVQIYAHRVSGDPIEWAREIIAKETPAVEAPAPVRSTPVSSRRICLNERQEEFARAILRGLTNEFEVWDDFEFGHFVCVNKTNKTQYAVRIETIGSKTWADCGCKDYEIRKHICKHMAQVLQTRTGTCSVA